MQTAKFALMVVNEARLECVRLEARHVHFTYVVHMSSLPLSVERKVRWQALTQDVHNRRQAADKCVRPL